MSLIPEHTHTHIHTALYCLQREPIEINAHPFCRHLEALGVSIYLVRMEICQRADFF